MQSFTQKFKKLPSIVKTEHLIKMTYIEKIMLKE